MLTPLSDDPYLPLIFLEAQMQRDTQFYGLLILKNRNYDLGSEIPYQLLLSGNIKILYLEDLLSLKNLSANLALLKLLVVEDSAIVTLGKSILNSAETEEDKLSIF